MPSPDILESLIEQTVGRRLDELAAQASPTPTQPERLTAQQVGAALKVHPKTVRNWLKHGCPCLYVGLRPRFLLTEVEEWLRTRVDGRAAWRRGAA